MQRIGRNIGRWLALMAAALLVACGGGGGGDSAPPVTPPAPTYTIGGNVTVTGGGALASGLVLQVNGGDSLPRSTTGTFTFATAVPASTTYTVTVSAQPTTQNCAVTNGSGTVGSSNVPNVAVACTPVPTRTVGGTVNGLLGSGIDLRLNGTSSFTNTQTGTFSFTFTTQIGEGNPYTVTVATHPSIPAQACSVVNGTGTVLIGANVTNVAVNCAFPAPRFAYVANLSNSQVQAFSVNPTDGSLTFVASTALGGTATNYAVGVEPSGRFAYVVSNGSPGTVTAATINPATGALTSFGAITAGTTPQALGIDPLSRALYVTNFSGNSVTGFRINPSNGRLVSLGGAAPAGTSPVSVAIEPRGRFAYVANAGGSGTVSQYSVASDGSLTFVASVNELTQPAPFAVEPLGRFGYTPRVQVNNVSAYTIGTTTGTLTSVGVPTPTGTAPSLVVFDPLGKFAFVINSPGGPALGSISRYSIDAATGALTSLGAVTSTGVEAPVAASIDPSGKFLYVLHSGAGGGGGTIRVFSVDASGGVSSTLTGLTVTNSASSFAITR